MVDKQRRKLSSPLIFRPIHDSCQQQPQPQTALKKDDSPLVNYGSFSDQSTHTTSSMLGPNSTTTSSTASSSSRETLVPQIPLTPMPVQSIQPLSLNQPSTLPLQGEQQVSTSAQHMSRRIKNLTDRLRGSSFESSSPENRKTTAPIWDLVESSSSEEQRGLHVSQPEETQSRDSSTKRTRSQSPRMILSNKQLSASPNNLTGVNTHCSLSSSMESQGFSEALTTSTDSAGSATRTTSTAGTNSSASGVISSKHGQWPAGPGSITSTMTSNSQSTVVRHSSLKSNMRAESVSPAADSSPTGEYNVSGADDTSRRQSSKINNSMSETQQVLSRISNLAKRKPRLDVFGLDLLAKRGSMEAFTNIMKSSDDNLSDVLGPPVQVSSRRPSRNHLGPSASNRFLTHPIPKLETAPVEGEVGSDVQIDAQPESQSPPPGITMHTSTLSSQSASCGAVDEFFNIEQQQVQKADEKLPTSGGIVQTASASVEFLPKNQLHADSNDQFSQIQMTSRRGGSKKHRKAQHEGQEQNEAQQNMQMKQREISPSPLNTVHHGPSTTAERREVMAKLHHQSAPPSSGKSTTMTTISPAPAPTAVSARLAEIFGSGRSAVVNSAAGFHRPSRNTASATATTATSSLTSPSVLQTSMVVSRLYCLKSYCIVPI